MNKRFEKMIELTGKPVSPGYASGSAFVLQSRHDQIVPSYTVESTDVENEIQRFNSAINSTIQDLKKIRFLFERSLGEYDAQIFDSHIAILDDKNFIGNIKNRIFNNLENAESAANSVIKEIVQKFTDIDNRLLAERAIDIQDIGSRLLKHLNENQKKVQLFPKDTILVADEIFPSDTVDFNREHLKGIVSVRGGETNHAAILARSLGIPMIIAVDRAMEAIENNMRLLVDGNTGTVIVSPSDSQQDTFTVLNRQYEKEAQAAVAEEVNECVTSDGIKISLWANISLPSETKDVSIYNLKGVGLLRSEYLFMKTETAPNAELQEIAYQDIAVNLQKASPLIIRTMDLGGDKNLIFLPNLIQDNPSLDLRGLRFSLKEDKLFREQISAILRVSTNHPVRILLPMVADVGDLVAAKKIIAETAFHEGIEKLPQIGAMIETPAAVFLSEEIAAESDFLSIGTNDLTQFILAADRLSSSMLNNYFALHPAVLRAIRTTLNSAEKVGRPISVCGEIAGDPVSACILVGLGFNKLCMSPARSARVRQAIRLSNVKSLRKLSLEACELSNITDIKTLYNDIESTLRRNQPASDSYSWSSVNE